MNQDSLVANKAFRTMLLGLEVAWALDGDDFQIQEISCRAKGDELCKLRVTLNA